MHIFHFFCNTHPYQTTHILYIRSSTIIIDGSILICLLIVNNIHSNQPSRPLNHFMMLLCYHMAYLDLGFVFKRKEYNERKKIILSMETYQGGPPQKSAQ